MGSILRAENISKSYQMKYGKISPLVDISLKINHGENVAIMGPSGSGKSTLLHILGCLDQPTVGSYYIEEKNTSDLNDDELSLIRAEKIGFIFQSFNLISHLTVYENLMVPFQYQSKNIDDVDQVIQEALQIVKLDKRKQHLTNELSGGEMQRAAIARTIVTRPKIILADEPTGNLDSKTGKDIISQLININKRGVTLILITHDESVAEQFQRVIHMQDGKIISDVKCG